MDMTGVKGLLFDKDGTLLDLHGTWGVVLNDLIWYSAGEGEQRVAEDLDVTGGLPDLLRKDHRGVDADDVIARLHHELPPLALD